MDKIIKLLVALGVACGAAGRMLSEYNRMKTQEQRTLTAKSKRRRKARRNVVSER